MGKVLVFIHEDKGRWQDIICFYSIKLGKTFSVLNFLGDIPVIRLKKRVNEDGVEKFQFIANLLNGKVGRNQ